MLRLPPPENTLKTTPEQKSNGSALLLGSLAALAVGIGIYIATKGKNGAPKTSSTKPVQQSQNNTANAFEDLRRRIINKFKMDETFWINKPQGMYSRILNVQYYQAVRHPVNPYSTRAACNSKIASITANSNSYVNVVPENGWHFRLPIQRSSAPLVDRISLNVYPEDALIAKLDKLVAQSNGMIEYKTSIGIKKWNSRHDPITIYFHRPVTQKDESIITQLVKPHVRSDKNMLGRKISDGIYQVFEPTEKDVLALINRAKQMGADPKLIDCLESDYWLVGAQLYTTNSKGQKIVRTSPGCLEAVKRFLDDLEKGVF